MNQEARTKKLERLFIAAAFEPKKPSNMNALQEKGRGESAAHNYYEKLIVVEIGGRMQIKTIRVYGK